MKMTLMLAALAAVAVQGASAADFTINIDPGAKPIRDVRKSTCGPLIGYAGCIAGLWSVAGDEFYFGPGREQTSAICRESGAWFQRMWNADSWFAQSKPNPFDPNSKDPQEVNRYKEYRQSRPDLAFKFWKENGIKVLFTLEAWGAERSKRQILDFVDFIVTNGYQDVVAGFELGNETYFAKPEQMDPLCVIWNAIIPEIKKRMPEVNIGIPVCELFEQNPDLTQVRSRMLAAGEIQRDTYFSAGYFNQTSARMIMNLKPNLDKISHVIYHAYGAESPYSCSYYGFQRFRNFAVAFPEIKGKRLWLSEIRPRSDEDNRCQRIFRESLVMSHYALMAICQPDMDGYNHHHFVDLSGAIYESTGGYWHNQWRDEGEHYRDYRAPEGKHHFEVGSLGVAYRILTEGIKEHPIILAHGTSKEMGTEDAFFASARVMDQVYARRRAIKEGKTGFLGFGGVPKVEGEVEYVAASNPSGNEFCLLMVNSKNKEVRADVTLKGREFAAPTYIAISCPEEHVDDRAVPGEGHWWRQVGWEDTQSGYSVVPMAPNDGLVPKKCDVLKVTIAPHTVQTVTVWVRPVPKPER